MPFRDPKGHLGDVLDALDQITKFIGFRSVSWCLKMRAERSGQSTRMHNARLVDLVGSARLDRLRLGS